MIIIYTTPSCSSCRKAKKWFADNDIEYVEKNLFNIKFTREDLIEILERTDYGFEDIISKRSKAFQEIDVDIYDMTINELIKFIQDNPSVLRRPIIIDDKRMQIGYSDEEIETFLPRCPGNKEHHLGCIKCRELNNNECDYERAFRKILHFDNATI